MLRLYILYVVLGLYTLYYSLLMWFFPTDGAVIQTDIALIFSIVLFFIAPAISLYKPNLAPGLGLMCLLGITPFGIHWVQYRMMDNFIEWDIENIIMYAAVAWYLATLIVTINTYTVRHNLKVKYYSRRIKLSLAFLPLLVAVIFAGYVWFALV